MLEPIGRGVLDRPVKPGDDSGDYGDAARQEARQFNTRFPSGLSSENAGTSISNRSPLSFTIW